MGDSVNALIQAAVAKRFPGQPVTPEMFRAILEQNAREGSSGPVPEVRNQEPPGPDTQPRTTVPKPVAKAASGGESAPTTKTDVTEGPYSGADVGIGPTREPSPDPTRPVPPRNAGVGVQSDVSPPVADVNTAIEDDPGPRSVNRADSDRSVTSSPLPTTAQPGSLDMSAIIDQAVAPASPVAATTAPASVAQQIPQEATGPQPPVQPPMPNQGVSNTIDPSMLQQFQGMLPDDPLGQRVIAAAAMLGVPAAVVAAVLGAGPAMRAGRTGAPAAASANPQVYTPPTASPPTSAPPPAAAAPPPTAAPTGPTASSTTVPRPPAPVPAPQTTSASPPAQMRAGPPSASYSGIARAPMAGAVPNYTGGLQQLGPLLDLLGKQQGAGVGGAGDPRLRGQRVPRI